MSTLVGDMCRICCHMALVLLAFNAFIQYFEFAIVFVHSFLYFKNSGIQTPDRNRLWYQHLLTLFALFFFYESNIEGITFGLC